MVEYELDGTGGLGKEVDRKTREGYVREIEVEIVMNRSIASSVVKWLQERIEEIDRISRDREEVTK